MQLYISFYIKNVFQTKSTIFISLHMPVEHWAIRQTCQPHPKTDHCLCTFFLDWVSQHAHASRYETFKYWPYPYDGLSISYCTPVSLNLLLYFVGNMCVHATYTFGGIEPLKAHVSNSKDMWFYQTSTLVKKRSQVLFTVLEIWRQGKKNLLPLKLSVTKQKSSSHVEIVPSYYLSIKRFSNLVTDTSSLLPKGLKGQEDFHGKERHQFKC